MNETYNINVQKWHEMSKLHKIGNMANEINRTFKIKEKNGDYLFYYFRSQSMLDMLIKEYNIKEFSIIKEIFENIIINDKEENNKRHILKELNEYLYAMQ